MTVENLVTFIQSVGFPIAVSVYLLWYNNKQSEVHKEEMNTLKDALNQNTLALVKIETFMRDVYGSEPTKGEE